MENKCCHSVTASLIEKHPKRVSQLLREYGVKSKPSAQTVNDSVVAFGEPFIMGLYDIHFEGESSLFGMGNKLTQKNEKGKGWQTFRNFFTKAGAIIRDGPQVPPSTESENTKEKEEEKPENSNTALWVVLAVIVLLIAAVLIKAKSQS